MRRMKNFRPKKGPEAKIQDEIKKYMAGEGWQVMVTNGNIYQVGFPDLYCVHDEHGQRWIDCKNPKGYSFTGAQKKLWPKIDAVVGIWIMMSVDDYKLLFLPSNLWSHWK